MFHKKQGGPPDRPFPHSDSCKIVEADPGVSIPWSEVERGHWTQICACGEQHYYATARKGARLDPFDPCTSRHGGACEFKDTTDRAVLRPSFGSGQDWTRATRGWSVAPAVSPGRCRTLRRRVLGLLAPAGRKGSC